MNGVSLNIRGIGVDSKVSWARRLKMKYKENFVGHQETQLLDYSKINVGDCWDSQDHDFERVNASGASGGLILIWDTGYFQKTEVIANRFFLIIIGTWKGIYGNTISVNIYGPHTPSEKRSYNLN